MNEEGADASGVMGWIERRVLCGPSAVAAADCTTATPAAAADDLAGVFDDEVGAIADQLAIHVERSAKCCLHLRGRIVRCLQSAHGNWNENLQYRDVVLSRKTDGKGFSHAGRPFRSHQTFV